MNPAPFLFRSENNNGACLTIEAPFRGINRRFYKKPAVTMASLELWMMVVT